MFLAAREDRSHGAIGGFPRAACWPFLGLGSVCQGITRMPTDGDYTAALMVGDDLASHEIEGNGIEVLCITHLYAAEFEAHDSRVIAASLEYIAAVGCRGPHRALLAWGWTVCPAYTIERIILMPEHAALLLQYAQTVQ